MVDDNRKPPGFVTDRAAEQNSDGAHDERAVDGQVAGAALQDGLDDDTRIEIALTSDDPEWIAYTFTVLGYLFSVDETTMARLEKRALTIALERTAFGNEALENAILAFIERRIAGRPDTARLFIYPMLSFLGSEARDTRALAYSVLLKVASDRPEYLTRHVDALTAMQCWGSETARVYAAGLVAALAELRPEYFPGGAEAPTVPPALEPDIAGNVPPANEKARADDIQPVVQPIIREEPRAPEKTADPVPPVAAKTGAQPPESASLREPAPAPKPVAESKVPPEARAAAQPEARREPARAPKSAAEIKAPIEVFDEPAPAPKPFVPVATAAREPERPAEGGKRSLTFGFSRKSKDGGLDSPSPAPAAKIAPGRDTDEMSEIIDSMSDITQMIKTGLPADGGRQMASAKKGSLAQTVADVKAVRENPAAVSARAAKAPKGPDAETGIIKETGIENPIKTSAANVATPVKKTLTAPADQTTKGRMVESPVKEHKKEPVKEPVIESVKEPVKSTLSPIVTPKAQKPAPGTGPEKIVPRPKIAIRPLKADDQKDKK